MARQTTRRAGRLPNAGSKKGGPRKLPGGGAQPIQGVFTREQKESIRTSLAGQMSGYDGGSDGGKLQTAFRDENLVGSGGSIDDFDGSTFFTPEVGIGGSGGGGGSGSGLAGRESVSQVGETQGQSLEDVVYGVKRKNRRVRRAKGE